MKEQPVVPVFINRKTRDHKGDKGHFTSHRANKTSELKKIQNYVRVTDHEHRLGFQRFQPEIKALFV